MADPRTYQPKKHGRIGPLKLQDKRNVNSELGPQDFVIPEYNPDLYPANPKFSEIGHDEAVLRIMTDRITSAINYKRVKEPDWYESLAFYLGTQDVTWNYRARQLVPVRNEKNIYKCFSTRNKIRPKVKKLTYQAFCKKPDAAVKPGTGSDLDRRAAIEARSILSHLDYKFDRDAQTRRVGHWAIITGMCATKFGWDSSVSAEMPNYDEDGNIIGSQIVPKQGDIVESIVPVFELLLDPESRSYGDVKWIIHQHVFNLSDIRDRWENGVFVEADTGQGIAGYVESRLAAVLGEYMRGTEPGPIKKNTAVIYECYEVPTNSYDSDLKDEGSYPDGRYIVCSSKVLLDYQEFWPHMDAKQLLIQGIRLPYAFMNYEECLGSLYGIGAVKDMLSPQKTINACVSREEEHLKTAWGKLLIEQGSQIPVNAFDDAIPNEKITFARGMNPPTHLDPPPLPNWVNEVKVTAEEDLDDISGLHEVNEASVPGTVGSGIAISKLQHSDAMAGSMFGSNIELYHKHRATIEIHIVGRNYIEPRLIYINEGYFGSISKSLNIPGTQNTPPQLQQSQSMQLAQGAGQEQLPPPPSMPTQLPPYVDDTDTPVMDVKAFQALQNGGSCHVVVIPGSAMAKDEDAERQEIMDLYKEGLFGPPGDPTTAGIVLSLFEFAGTDEIVEAVRKAAMDRMRFQILMTPNPVSVQAQKNAGDMQLEQAKMNREVQLENAKQQHEGAILALKDQLQQEQSQRELQYQMLMKQQEAYITLHQALLDKLHPDIRLNGTLTPVETAAAMQTIGFPTYLIYSRRQRQIACRRSQMRSKLKR